MENLYFRCFLDSLQSYQLNVVQLEMWIVFGEGILNVFTSFVRSNPFTQLSPSFYIFLGYLHSSLDKSSQDHFGSNIVLVIGTTNDK